MDIRTENLLQNTIRYVAKNSPYYRDLFALHQINHEDIRTVDDLVRIPTTNKDNLQLQNEKFLCVNPEHVAEYTTTSGTLGTPVTIALTKNDIERLAINEYNSFLQMELSGKDTIQLLLTLDKQFMAGIAYYLGAQKIGAAIVRSGPGSPSFQLTVLQRHKPTVWVVVPSYLVNFLSFLEEQGIDPNSLTVKKVLCIGEPIRDSNLQYNALGKRIASKWNVKLFSTYASTEMQTAFTECKCGNGGHIQPELIVAEILDDNGDPVKDGNYGELTITTLNIEAMPLVRFRTGDVCRFYKEPCACGNSTWRISPLLGRKNQMIKYKGTTLFPTAIVDMLQSVNFIDEFCIILRRDDLNQDQIHVYVTSTTASNEVLDTLRQVSKSTLKVTLSFYCISTEEMESLLYPNQNRKPFRIQDQRTSTANER